MKAKSIVFFVLAVAVSLLAATYRWGDSAHSIGVIRAAGGEARHPVHLQGGGSGYTLIATATVLPPYRGDARVVLEGDPPMEHRISLSGPILDLGIRRNPELRDNVVRGLRPLDRLALWVTMTPPAADPVCGMPVQEGFLSLSLGGREYRFCSPECLEVFRRDPGKYPDRTAAQGRYTLAFYDTKTDRPVLSVPVIFHGKGEAHDAAGHQH